MVLRLENQELGKRNNAHSFIFKKNMQEKREQVFSYKYKNWGSNINKI